MCVILVCEEMVPPTAVLEACEEQNPGGAGIAWREKDLICWEKGVAMTTADILKRMKVIKLPYVIHYRIASVGGICDELCHPFPYGAADTRSKGASKRGVVFHNGTLHSWKRDMKDAALYSNTPIPDGRWSDSRALAYLAGIYGTGYMELVDEKVVTMTPGRGPLIFGSLNAGWNFKKLDGDKGIWFSNDLWEKKLDGNTSGTNAGAVSGPTVGSFAGRGGVGYGRGNRDARVSTTTTASSGSHDPRFACQPWKKPADCDHTEGQYSHYNSMRFCGACGIRLDPVKNEPWLTADTNADNDTSPNENPVAAAARLLAEAKGTIMGPSENIAQRVRRLVVAASVREGRA